MPRLLLVEDEPILLDAVCKGLSAEGFDVVCAGNGREAMDFFFAARPDAMILDLMLPDANGLSLLENMRQIGFKNPVLILSACDSVDQRVTCLNSGADDYLVKPFVFTELVARVKAILRRTTGPAESIMSMDDIVLDLVTRKVTQAGKPVELTARQFELLAYLMKHRNQVVSRDSLARDIWREETASWTNLIEVQVNRLRNKLEGDGRKLRLHTIRGEGYLLGDRPS